MEVIWETEAKLANCEEIDLEPCVWWELYGFTPMFFAEIQLSMSAETWRCEEEVKLTG